MYVSKYYTCEEIDQRLLQGYYDDFVKAGFGGTINEFWAFVLSIKNKVDKKEGYDLSKNDFTDELKAKLDGIEEHANYITKVSQLENDLKYQTEEEVKQMISDLVDGADDALDTLKELAEALGNDPNFATTITNKLTDLRTALTEEVNRAKEAEAALGAAVAAVQDNLEYGLDQINKKIDTVKADLKAEIDRVEKKVDKNAEDIKDLEDKVNQGNGELEKELKDLIQKEKDERIAADNEIKESVNDLKTLHINDKASLESKIAEETANRTNADTVLDSKINEEITNRQADTLALQGKIDQEKVDRHSEDQVLHNEISKEVTDRTNADNALQGNIDKEVQARTVADQVLQNNIDSEATTRAAQDLVLEHKIEDVKEQGVEDKEQLLNAIAAEAAAREKGDKDLDTKKVDKREGYSLTKNDFTDILKAKLDGIEEKANYITHLSQLINDSGFQTEEEVNAAIQKIIGSAPEVLDTLKEIADALGNDPNFAATITKKLAAITEQVNQEIEDRIAGDEANSAEVAAEVQARKDADTALETKLKEYVDNKSAIGDAALGVVKDNLNKEIQDRKDADAAIQSSLDKEIAERKTADEAYTQSLANVNQRISDLALSMQESINTLRNELTEQVNANTTAIATNQHSIERNSEAITNLTKTVGDNYKEVKDMINEEIIDRTNADSALSSRIDTLNIDLNTESVERKAADQVLQVNLDKEVADRTAADKALSTEFTAKLDNTKQALESEVGNINTKLEQEKENRIAGDNALGVRIDSLEAGNTDAMNELKAKVNANTTAINAEKDRAIAKETSLEAKIDTNLQNHKDDMAGINKDILTEKNDRLAGDTLLQTNIDKESTERANQDTLISNAVAQEKADRIAADQAMDDKKVDKVDGKVLSSNDFTDLLYAKLDGIEEHANYITKVSQLLNDSDFQNAEQVEAAIQKIIGSAPEVLDTLAEIAKALGDDPNFAATMTAKLTELENKLEAEKNLREQGDNTLQQSFTNLSNTLTTTVNELRTFVSETRTELLTSLNATNALVTQNTANIQRNLELIQGIQDNINGNYTAITDLLNNEIAARKAEDIRLEAKIDQNTSDLNTEREERKAADKVLQDNIDAEEAARIAADTALGKRIDKEIQDRTDADTALDNKFTNITDDHEERLEAEEGTSDALPDTMVTDVSTVTRTDTQLSFKVKTSTKDKANNQYGEEVEATKNLLPVTQTLAGVMSAADKVKLDGLDPNSLTDLSAASDANKVTVTVTKDNGLNADTTETFDLPQVSATKAGTMTAKDKVELDRISTANFALGAVTPNETTVGIAATKTVVEDGTVEQNPITLPASTTEKAGVQTAADKKLFDSIPDNIIILSGDKPVEVGQQSSHVTLTHNFSSKKEEGIYTHEPEDYKTTYIPAATTEKAGVMTAQDKVNLDETLPNAIAQEVQDRKDAIEALDGKSEAALAQEVADRKAADTALDTKFTKAVNDEATARTSADTALGARIDKEIADRTAADTTLETKLQNNINTLEAKHDAFVATKGKADGFAPLDGKGLVPANHLPSYVDDVLEVYATYDVSPTGGLTNVQLYTDAGHQTPVVGESGKIYINVADGEPPYQFRWSGTKFVDSNTSSLIIGEIAGTAFEGSRGKHLEDVVSSMPKNLISKVSIANKNKRNVIILCNYSATDGQGHYIDKPDGMVIPLTPATTQEAGLMDANSVIKLNQTLPDAIEAEQEARIAKDNAHDTFNSSLPGIILTGFTLTHNSTNVRATLNNKTKSAEGKTYEGATDLIRDILAATKTTAGVMTAADKTNLDNTVQGLANEITNRTNAINALRTELKTYVDDLIADTGSDVTALETKVNNHIANKSNPHTVTKTQVGLGNVNNTSDADKPVSTAQATAIADAKAAGTTAQTSINSHAGRKDNPHTVTRAQLGLATTDQVVFAKTTAPSGFWKESSDERLKSNIKPLTHTLEQICSIPTESFIMDGKEDEGTIAQGLEAAGFNHYVEEDPRTKDSVPNPEEFETVVIDGEEYVLVKQVKYHKMSTLAIEGIKLLYEEIKALKAEISELRNLKDVD
ncbi:MAG: chaperone of endosialidase [Bacteriophage sp.]|nr:MAG: chaperone of endosialidase [Bacteriophage sp.]